MLGPIKTLVHSTLFELLTVPCYLFLVFNIFSPPIAESLQLQWSPCFELTLLAFLLNHIPHHLMHQRTVIVSIIYTSFKSETAVGISCYRFVNLSNLLLIRYFIPQKIKKQQFCRMPFKGLGWKIVLVREQHQSVHAFQSHLAACIRLGHCSLS